MASALLPLGDILHRLRQDRYPLSMDAVAKASGLDPKTVAGIENAQGDPQLSSLVRLAAHYGYWICITPIRPRDYKGANPADRPARL